jgi:hypothetical protein
MDATTLVASALLLGAWTAHERPFIVGTLLTMAALTASSHVWFPLLRQAMQ